MEDGRVSRRDCGQRIALYPVLVLLCTTAVDALLGAAYCLLLAEEFLYTDHSPAENPGDRRAAQPYLQGLASAAYIRLPGRWPNKGNGVSGPFSVVKNDKRQLIMLLIPCADML